MIQTKYLAVLAIAAVAVVVVVAVLASGVLSKDSENTDKEGDKGGDGGGDGGGNGGGDGGGGGEINKIKITLTIDSRVEVTHNGVKISSGVPFFVPENENSVPLKIKTPSGGRIVFRCWSEDNPFFDYEANNESNKAATYSLSLNRDFCEGDLVGEIVFTPL